MKILLASTIVSTIRGRIREHGRGRGGEERD
jgi:hypothetical protein